MWQSLYVVCIKVFIQRLNSGWINPTFPKQMCMRISWCRENERDKYLLLISSKSSNSWSLPTPLESMLPQIVFVFPFPQSSHQPYFQCIDPRCNLPQPQTQGLGWRLGIKSNVFRNFDEIKIHHKIHTNYGRPFVVVSARGNSFLVGRTGWHYVVVAIL
jgi:hypothetical protein